MDTFARKSLARRARDGGMNPNFWYPGGFSHELARGKSIETKFWGREIVIYRDERGQAHALQNRCPHRGIKLSHGTVEGCKMVCLYHGWTFDPDGKLVEMKHDKFGKKLPMLSVESYPVRERYGVLWFFPGDPALAEKVPLVEVEHGDGPDAWPCMRFAYTWRAHHSMVIDNLCNLTHLWVHGKWVPYSDTIMADWTAEGDRITIHWQHELRRDFLHPISAPFFRRHKGSNLSDTHMIYDYPYQSATTMGKSRSINFMLPMSEKETRVFTIQYWNNVPIPMLGHIQWPRPIVRLGVQALKPYVWEVFRQDGFTVEQEQLAYDADPSAPIPEPNPVVKRFNELSVRKWDEHVSGQQPGDPTRMKVI